MPRQPRTRALERVIHRVWQRAQGAASQEEHELGSITLRLLGLIRKGLPATLDLAAVEAFGCSFNVWRQRNLGRKAAMAWELAALIPDYDPTATPATPPLEWTVHRLQPTEISQPKPMREAPQTARRPAKRVS